MDRTAPETIFVKTATFWHGRESPGHLCQRKVEVLPPALCPTGPLLRPVSERLHKAPTISRASPEFSQHGNRWSVNPTSYFKGKREFILVDGTEVCKTRLVRPFGLSTKRRCSESAASPTGHTCLPITLFSRCCPIKEMEFPLKKVLLEKDFLCVHAREGKI